MIERMSGTLVALALAGCLLGGCTNTQDVLGTATYGVDGNQVVKTGAYPKLGGPLEAAADQLSDEETAGMKTELEALAAERSGNSSSDALYKKRLAMMRELARNHEKDVAAEIEN